MSEGAPQTYISVKKSDGTVVRMTLADFKIYRNNKQQVTSDGQQVTGENTQTTSNKLSIINVVEEKVTDDLMVVADTPHELATTTPVVDLFVNEAKAKMWKSEDHASLLDEKIGAQDIKPASMALPTIPSRDSALLHAVLDGLSFTIPENVTGRLQSLIESRIKDVRTDEDVIMYAIRPEAEGGLGLNDEQAAILLETTLDTLNLTPSSEIEGDEPVVAPSEEVIPQPVPSVEMPQKKSAPAFSYDQTRDEMPWQPHFAPESPRAPTSTLSTQEGRPMVQDVHLPEQAPRTMGPIDEFREFTVTDLHRLGNNPAQVTAIMADKFLVLKEESFVLYLDAVDAFRQSPLYRRYQSLLLTAINEGISLQTALEYDEEGMTMADVEMIVGILKSVSY